MTKALIVVDTQVDFIEGGSLAVEGGLVVANRIADGISALNGSSLYDYVVATKDYHNRTGDNGGHFGDPPDFVDTWPVHCVGGTAGSDFAPPIQAISGRFDAIFLKGQGKPAYSGFEGWGPVDGAGKQWALAGWLKDHNVSEVDVCGIATDHCVRATAKDAIDLGFVTKIIPEWCVAVGGKKAHNKVIKEINV